MAGPARLYEAVARLGLALARRAPLVIFLDDAQWTDAGTRDLVRYTVQRWTESGARTLVLVAVRMEDGGTQRLLATWLGGLERDAPTARLVLERLAREDVVQLAGALAGDSNLHQNTGARPIGGDAVTSFGNWLAEKTGGRPLYITQVLQALVHGGAPAILETERAPAAALARHALAAGLAGWNG
jgi:predicted ATPase